MQNIKIILSGFLMGTVETVPGVSGSTIALILGIYEKFIDLLHDASTFIKTLLLFLLRKASKEELTKSYKNINLSFAIKLFLGMAFGVIISTFVLSYLLEHFRAYTYAVFFGLILFSLPIPYKMIEEKNIKMHSIIAITALLFFILFGFKEQVVENPSLVLLFISGIFGISGLVLPGISGSFVLVIFGVYDYVFSIVKKVLTLKASGEELFSLIIFASGIIIGFASFIKVLKYLLANHKDILLAFILGIMIASLRIIWPFIEVLESGEIVQVDVLRFELAQIATIIVLVFLSGGLTYALTRINNSDTI